MLAQIAHRAPASRGGQTPNYFCAPEGRRCCSSLVGNEPTALVAPCLASAKTPARPCGSIRAPLRKAPSIGLPKGASNNSGVFAATTDTMCPCPIPRRTSGETLLQAQVPSRRRWRRHRSVRRPLPQKVGPLPLPFAPREAFSPSHSGRAPSNCDRSWPNRCFW